MRRWLTALVVGALLTATGEAAAAIRFHERTVPVRVFGTTGQRAAAARAMRAWNAAGARVRLVVAGRRRARVIVRYGQPPTGDHLGCVGVIGLTRVRYRGNGAITRARVWVAPGCRRSSTVRATTHELGHALGLVHTDGRCSIMNSVDSQCGGPPRRGAWRCRLLERVDVSHVVGLYGGRRRPVTRRVWCG